MYGCLDPFNNAREAKKIRAPVYVVHGTRDDEVPIEHGKMIVANAQQAHEPFWVAGAGHNDLLEVAGDAASLVPLLGLGQRMKERNAGGHAIKRRRSCGNPALKPLILNETLFEADAMYISKRGLLDMSNDDLKDEP